MRRGSLALLRVLLIILLVVVLLLRLLLLIILLLFRLARVVIGLGLLGIGLFPARVGVGIGVAVFGEFLGLVGFLFEDFEDVGVGLLDEVFGFSFSGCDEGAEAGDVKLGR